MPIAFTNIQIFYFSYQFRTNFDMVLTTLLQLKKESNPLEMDLFHNFKLNTTILKLYELLHQTNLNSVIYFLQF